MGAIFPESLGVIQKYLHVFTFGHKDMIGMLKYEQSMLSNIANAVEAIPKESFGKEWFMDNFKVSVRRAFPKCGLPYLRAQYCLIRKIPGTQWVVHIDTVYTNSSNVHVYELIFQETDTGLQLSGISRGLMNDGLRAGVETLVGSWVYEGEVTGRVGKNTIARNNRCYPASIWRELVTKMRRKKK